MIQCYYYISIYMPRAVAHMPAIGCLFIFSRCKPPRCLTCEASFETRASLARHKKLLSQSKKRGTKAKKMHTELEPSTPYLVLSCEAMLGVTKPAKSTALGSPAQRRASERRRSRGTGGDGLGVHGRRAELPAVVPLVAVAPVGVTRQ